MTSLHRAYKHNVNDITLFKSWVCACIQDRGTGLCKCSLASEIRSLCQTHKSFAAYALVSYILSQNLFLKLLSDSFAVRGCWCSRIPLWECSSSLHIVIRCISSIHPLVRFIPWWGRLACYQLLLCSVFLTCWVTCLFQSDLSGFPELVQHSSPQGSIGIACW